jgi:uncharacterized protein (TIGR02646 family)
MHWVNRGNEPSSLKRIRKGYNRGWVRFYRKNQGKKPTDEKWRQFYQHVSTRFSSLCAYCECETKGEIDHFRPKKVFPESVYQWSNWVFACHDCNNCKGEEWPHFGYVNPCAQERKERPEKYFHFDLQTGEILPRDSLNPQRRQRAMDTIRQLRLNGFHQLKRRITWIACFSEAFVSRRKNPQNLRAFVRQMINRNTALSSLSRTVVMKRGRTR